MYAAFCNCNPACCAVCVCVCNTAGCAVCAILHVVCMCVCVECIYEAKHRQFSCQQLFATWILESMESWKSYQIRYNVMYRYGCPNRTSLETFWTIVFWISDACSQRPGGGPAFACAWWVSPWCSARWQSQWRRLRLFNYLSFWLFSFLFNGGDSACSKDCFID